MNNYKIGIDVEIKINDEQRTISYNLLVEHLEEFIVDIKNTEFEIEEVLYVESLNHQNLETIKL